jgi:hypothetical protein
MKTRYQFCGAVLATSLLSLFAASGVAQHPSPQQDSPTLSSAVHSARYPEALCVHCIVPQWDRGYLLHREFDRDPSAVTMYDRDGKKVLEARVQLTDAATVSLSAAGATQAGGILSVGAASMTDGSIQGFIAKTDRTGKTVESVHLGRFRPRQVCETTDGTAWTLGYDLSFRDSPNTDRNVLRHYSFEKGLLESLVTMDSISKSSDAFLQMSSPNKSFLSCNQDRVSVLFASFGQYIEVNGSDRKVARWSVTPLEIPGGKANGFAATEDGRVFVSFQGFNEGDNTVTQGLYELKAGTKTSVATFTPVVGTVTKQNRDGGFADETFERVFGADGDEIVLHRLGDGPSVSWARVTATFSSPD